MQLVDPRAAYVLACELRRRFSFPRRYKLSRQEGFSQVLKQTAQISRWFSIYAQPNDLGCARLGISVAKKVVPNAVQRNRIKRMVREIFRQQTRNRAEKDIVIRLRKRVDGQDWHKATAVLKESLGLVLIEK